MTDFSAIMNSIFALLDEGCKAVGFVSPSHFIPHVHAIIGALHNEGRHPVIVYNSNGYDNADELVRLEGLVDIYLPDMKYMDRSLSAAFSDAPDYPETAQSALREMFRQKGSTLRYLDDHYAESGMIVRHLVLPGFIDNSIEVLRWIAEELSPKLSVSLMSQYYPPAGVLQHPQLGRPLNRSEYMSVVREMERLGMVNGWLQDPLSHVHYRPDFKKKHPFG
jgi:putative pyruvate formate lyase activating enzyme